jgi:CheY-like chemotaxis protein
VRSGARALVVEDLEYNAHALESMLRKLGFEVDIALDGGSALARFEKTSYQTVFLDFDLPDMNGIELAKKLRTLGPQGRASMIVATTAYSSIRDREACLAAGMDHFLTKPITPEKLASLVAAVPGPQLPSPPVQVPGPDEIDLRLIHYLAEGSPEAFDRELERFLHAFHVAVTALSSAAEKNRPAALASAAHGVLSYARLVGCVELGRAASELEAAAQAGDTTECSVRTTETLACAARLRERLRRLLHPEEAPA